MKQVQLYYATNRRHQGRDRWNPTGYGADFSSDGMENLRFGRVLVNADEAKVDRLLRKKTGLGQGDGEALAHYFTSQASARKGASIQAFRESLDPTCSDANQPSPVYGSRAMFDDVRKLMAANTDVVVYVHGFNVSWQEAVGSALALQEMLALPVASPPAAQRFAVVLFTWPSDGQALPFASYKSDRADAHGSGGAFGRAFLKLRDFLQRLTGDQGRCGHALHLLCHSMGNFVLQQALAKVDEFTPGSAKARVFQEVFLCAADVDDDILEPDQAMGRLHEIARGVNVYFNRGDVALHVSDYTKGNPERLGTAGAARPAMLHSKIRQVDCSDIVKGFTEHSYYLDGLVNQDIRQTLHLIPQDSDTRARDRSPIARNTWVLRVPKEEQ